MRAIANALDGMRRAQAAPCRMERQGLRDAIVRTNAEGVAALVDRQKVGRPPALGEGDFALVAERSRQSLAQTVRGGGVGE